MAAELDTTKGSTVLARRNALRKRHVILCTPNIKRDVDRLLDVWKRNPPAGLAVDGFELVRVVRSADGTIVKVPLRVAAAREEASGSVAFYRLDRRSGAWVEVYPPLAVVSALLRRGSWPGLPRVDHEVEG